MSAALKECHIEEDGPTWSFRSDADKYDESVRKGIIHKELVKKLKINPLKPEESVALRR